MAALTTTFGMPLVIEIGVFFDVLIGLLLMGVFAFRIRDTFDHLDYRSCDGFEADRMILLTPLLIALLGLL